eukprot:CAMPEP_0194377550 /NCGR_PEP_ID=MMETSP0174-20130528/31760_1 /TAXON_ID=216777 /ORGANISM="Proboscia alata, Strain PI-D3" /LENGTH=45 /DNA_ID= /DNA_START= /DNA_END= /DNA_ORIENTATION=
MVHRQPLEWLACIRMGIGDYFDFIGYTRAGPMTLAKKYVQLYQLP